MLDINILHQLDDLMANTLYSAEIAHLPRRSRAEVEALIILARMNDHSAREALVIDCLTHALGVARYIYHERRLRHDDLLDLVQVASERMVERLDKALTTSAPAAYLRGIARRSILDYCIYHSGMIQLPEYSRSVLQKLNPYPATVVSLDRPLGDDEEYSLVELIEAPAPQPELDEQRKQKYSTLLHSAIHRLPREQRETLVRLYGLFGQPAETTDEIGRPELVRSRAYEARKKLRSILAEHLHELIDSNTVHKDD